VRIFCVACSTTRLESTSRRVILAESSPTSCFDDGEVHTQRGELLAPGVVQLARTRARSTSCDSTNVRERVCAGTRPVLRWVSASFLLGNVGVRAQHANGLTAFRRAGLFPSGQYPPPLAQLPVALPDVECELGNRPAT